MTIDDIRAASQRNRGVVIRTPVLPSSSLSRLIGADIWVKAENLQRTGSFKIRGAMNAVGLMTDRERGVVAASAGNHAQGVALAAAELGVEATIFMPVTASLPKVAATQEYGAQVELAGRDLGESVDLATAYARETGATLIHPYDDPAIVAGQGTIGLELAQQVDGLQTVLVPVGGGGLIAGISLALKELVPGVRIVGVQAAAMASYVQARQRGVLAAVEPVPTVADGIAVSRPSELCFAMIERFVDDLVAVDDERIAESVAVLLERAKLLVEPAAAATIAALLDGRVKAEGRTVAVLSGGNIDLLLLDGLIQHGLGAKGRFASLEVRVPDRPGSLATLLEAVGAAGGNILSVEHHRADLGVAFGQVEIRLTMETRSPEHFEEIVARLDGYDVRSTHGGGFNGSSS